MKTKVIYWNTAALQESGDLALNTVKGWLGLSSQDGTSIPLGMCATTCCRERVRFGGKPALGLCVVSVPRTAPWPAQCRSSSVLDSLQANRVVCPPTSMSIWEYMWVFSYTRFPSIDQSSRLSNRVWWGFSYNRRYARRRRSVELRLPGREQFSIRSTIFVSPWLRRRREW